MKICVCSDSHGNTHGILRMLQTEKPDGFIFLGDGWRDIDERMLAQCTILTTVTGNCDLGCPWPDERIVELFGRRVLLTHGHRHHVKQGLDSLADYAQRAGADTALYGHTHAADDREARGVLLLNPGAMKSREERYIVLTDSPGGFAFEYRACRW